MNVKAVLVQRISKNGNPYDAIELTFPNDYKKLVFLNQAELALLRNATSSATSSSSSPVQPSVSK